jgi:hypothetical protein
MARKKEPAKPLFALKHDFVASLDNVCHEAIMLMQAVDMVIRHGEVPESIKTILVERAAAMRSALSEDEVVS